MTITAGPGYERSYTWTTAYRLTLYEMAARCSSAPSAKPRWLPLLGPAP
ncbi:hypothetical protein [Streptomyces sp. 8K308]|nr:hypothetical protein [Streptomyces sp. 8K308]